MSAVPVFYLYNTLGCHLCDDAMEILEDLHAQMAHQFQPQEPGSSLGGFFEIVKVDIADDDQLIDRYGQKIPVLLSADRLNELCWPFDVQSVYEFMTSCLRKSGEVEE